jgi:hypothetical protein
MPESSASGARARVAQLHGTLTATAPRRRAFRVFVVLFALWLLTSLFAWLAGPALLVNWATGFVEREFGHRLVIRELRINPLKLALTVEGFSLADSGNREIVGFRAMVVDVDVTSAVRAMAILDEFRLDGLTLNVERLDADRFNFSELADRLAARFAAKQTATASAPVAAPADAKGAALYFLIRHLDVSDAALRFADHTRTPVYESWMRPLNLRMDDLTSRPDREAPYNISATLGTGGTVAWEGDLSLEPLRSKGAVSLAGFGLSAAYDYVKDSFGFALPQGTLDARIDYFADFSGTQSVLRIDDGRAEVKGLAITGLDDKPLFAFDSTRVAGVRADIMKTTATVERFETRGGRIHVELDEQGVSNIERALVPRARPVARNTAAQKKPQSTAMAAAPAASQSASAAPAQADENTGARSVWQVELQKLAILDYALDVADRSTTPAAQLRLADVNFETGVIRLPDLPAIDFTFAGVFQESGKIGARGRYTLAGGIIDTDVEITELPLAPLSPYLARVGRFTLTSGTLRWQGNVKGKGNLADGMQVKGSAGLRGLAVRDDIRQTRLAALQDLAIDGIEFDDRAARLAIRTITLAGPDVDVAVDAKGISNFQRVMLPVSAPAAGGNLAAAPAVASQPATPAEKKAPAKTDARPLAIRIDTVVLRDGKVSIRDDSPDMSFNAQVAGLNGRIEGLGTDPARRAKVQLDGTINRYAPLSVSGSINPLAAETYADVQVRLASLDLSALTPYTVTYIAYPLARGQLGVELDWKVDQRKFESKNRVVIKGLALGEKRAAPRAVKAPVKLGIALLTNRDGDADLNVPAFGDLDDPQFRYGRVILKALGNLITRAATAPFAALGNMGGNKADVVEFVPGVAVMTAAESEKLGKLAGTLVEKPMLTLAITGAASAASDRAALQQAELSLRVRRAWLDANRKRGMTVEQVVLNEDERAERLAALYHAATGLRLDALRDAAGKPLAVAERIAAAEQALLPGIAIDDGALRELARQRSQNVKDTLLAGGVQEARLVIVDGKVIVAGGDAVPTTLALEAR